MRTVATTVKTATVDYKHGVAHARQFFFFGCVWTGCSCGAPCWPAVLLKKRRLFRSYSIVLYRVFFEELKIASVKTDKLHIGEIFKLSLPFKSVISIGKYKMMPLVDSHINWVYSSHKPSTQLPVIFKQLARPQWPRSDLVMMTSSLLRAEI